MIPFRKSIGFRLLGISFILLAFPLLVDSFILVQQRYMRRIAEAKGYLVEVAHFRELPLAEILPLNKPLLDVISYFLKLQTDFPTKPDEELNKKLKKIANVGDFSGIFLLEITNDSRIIVTASNFPDYVGKDYTDFFRLNDIFSTTSLERGFSSYISYSTKTLEPFFVVAHSVYSLEEDRTIGILAVSDDITHKLKKILEKDEYPYSVSFALLLPSTIVFDSTDPDLRFQYFLPLKPEYKQLFMEEEPLSANRMPDKPIKVTDQIGHPFFEFNWKGEEQIGYVSKLPGANFGLLTYASKDQIFRSPVINFFNIYGIYGLILVIGGGVAYLLTMRMAKPIQSLSLVMQKIQKGDLEFRYQKDHLGFEINLLGNIFNEMVDAVLEQKKVAEEERVARETYARELRLGQQVQLSLLPQKMPRYPGVDVAELYIPAIEVGGDFYDIFVKQGTRGESQLVLAVADASGKGVQACFYSLSVRNMLRTYAKEYDDMGEAMTATNNLFRLDTAETGMFVTVLMGTYDYNSGIFNYFSSGHNPAIVRREEGEIEMLGHHGVAMGVVPVKDQHAEPFQLKKGDAVILYTDGITEAHNEKFELYGEERLKNLVKSEGWRSSSEIVERIVSDVNSFAGKSPQHDDITLLVMKTI